LRQLKLTTSTRTSAWPCTRRNAWSAKSRLLHRCCSECTLIEQVNIPRQSRGL